MSRIALILPLFAASCITDKVEIRNKTDLELDHDLVLQAVYRLWENDTGGLIITFVSPEDGAIDSRDHGPLQADKIQVVYEGSIPDSSLVHELIHWRLNKMYDREIGESAADHTAVDWLLEDIVNEELRQ